MKTKRIEKVMAKVSSFEKYEEAAFETPFIQKQGPDITDVTDPVEMNRFFKYETT